MLNIATALTPRSWRHTVLIVGLIVATCGRASGESLQALDAIEDTVAAFVRLQSRTNPETTQIEVNALDPRLRLTACTDPLETFLPAGARFPGNTTVGVRCPSGTRWKIYVSVSVKLFGDVVVAREPLARGTLLAAADIERVQRDLGRVPAGYLADPREVVGKKLKRPVGLGGVLTSRMLETPHIVRRGQRVTIRGGDPGRGLEVQMAGKALADGRPGETIRVENLTSKKIIEGTVGYDGTVEVRL